MERYITENEIVVKRYESAMAIQKVLLEEGHVVMISREEQFWIVNWIWDPDDRADRNAVIFIDRANYEYEEYMKEKRNEEEE